MRGYRHKERDVENTKTENKGPGPQKERERETIVRRKSRKRPGRGEMIDRRRRRRPGRRGRHERQTEMRGSPAVVHDDGVRDESVDTCRHEYSGAAEHRGTGHEDSSGR